MATPFDVEKKLKRIHPEFLTENEKNILWSKIEHEINKKEQLSATGYRFPIFSIFSQRRFALAALLISILIGSSAVTIAAADNAKPGDILFPIDIAVEKVQLVFSIGEKKDRLRLKFAEERLSEVKMVLASVVSYHSDQTATSSLPQDSTSTDSQISTSTDSQEATSTPPEETQINVGKAEIAFEIALAQLEETKKKLEEKGNTVAVAAINNIIRELTELAENHLAELENFKAKIKTDDEKLKIEIKASIDNLKMKFKFEQKNKKEKGESEFNVPDSNSKAEIEIKDGDLEITHPIEGQSEEDDEEDNNDDENEDREEAEEKIKEAEEEKEEIIEEAEKEGIEFLFDVFAEFDDLLAQAKAAFEAENFQEAKNLAKQAKEALEQVEELIEDEDDEDGKITICHIPPGSPDNPQTIRVGRASAKAHLAHGDTIGPCGEVPTPDTTAPVISNLTSTTTTSTAEISWDTDEASDSIVWYSTTTPLVISTTTPFVSSANLVTNHTLSLTNLNASTTYYFIIASTDAAGNTATSAESSFTTLEIPTPDTTAPVISNLTSTTT
ncbi:MAG: DUF5667 domain-containing protein, partial [Candidatus Aminicenantia bacterium]